MAIVLMCHENRYNHNLSLFAIVTPAARQQRGAYTREMDEGIHHLVAWISAFAKMTEGDKSFFSRK